MAQALAIGAIGTSGILGASAAHTQGQAASRMATMNANQLDAAANQTDDAAVQQNATAQLKAKETKRQATLLQSRVIALAAANGGDVQEKGVNKILLDITKQGEYNSLMDLFNGSSAAYELHQKATNMRLQAVGTRYEGKAARRSGNMAAEGSILSSAGTAATFSSKYNNAANTNASAGGSVASPSYTTGGMPNTQLYSKYN